MDKEKQIEEMARVIKSSLEGLGSGNFNFTGDEFSIMLAKAIYAAGYRKQSGWISVGERLPQQRERVLCYSPGKKSRSIFVGYIGKPLDEDFSIGLILRKHPEYANCKVKYENDFYGTTVLRVEKGGAE